MRMRKWRVIDRHVLDVNKTSGEIIAPNSLDFMMIYFFYIDYAAANWPITEYRSSISLPYTLIACNFHVFCVCKVVHWLFYLHTFVMHRHVSSQYFVFHPNVKNTKLLDSSTNGMDIKKLDICVIFIFNCVLLTKFLLYWLLTALYY